MSFYEGTKVRWSDLVYYISRFNDGKVDLCAHLIARRKDGSIRHTYCEVYGVPAEKVADISVKTEEKRPRRALQQKTRRVGRAAAR